MENIKELMLIHSEMKYVSSVPIEGVNILLTPQFYTVKREEIPVQYAYQAKRIAPSLFEGLLENSESYKYFVFKEEDIWVFIAYDLERIKTFLQSKGLKAEQVSKIYFAEQAVKHMTSPLLLGDVEALVNLNGTMTVVPQAVLSPDEKPMHLSSSISLSKGVSFEGRGKSYISTNESYTIAVILALFAMLYFIEGSRYGGENVAQEQEMQSLLEKYPALQSSYTRESIARKYKVIDKKERRKRDVVKALSQMIFKGSTLTTLSLNDKKFNAEFACKDKNVNKKLQELAKKKKFNASVLTNGNDVKIEGTL